MEMKEFKQLFSKPPFIRYIRFTKADGNEREMICTRSVDYIPEDKAPSGTRESLDTDTALPVFDLLIKEWRSVRPDTIIEELPVGTAELEIILASVK
jgi:hypothetical protein